METIWVNRLIAGDWTWGQVPEKRKAGVRQKLAMCVAAGEITGDKMKEIIGG